MSSSTSSSDAASGGLDRAVRIALVLIVTLALLEGVTREFLVPASKDLGRFETYGERAQQLVAGPAPRIALIGNSTTERGVQLDLFEREWQAHTGSAASADMFVADASGVNTWYWIVSRIFWKPNLKPELFVVIYYGGGLTDSNQMDIGSIAQFFSGVGDRRKLFAEDLVTLEQRVDYLLSSVSQMWATRDRIRERSLRIVPGYAAFATRINTINYEQERRTQPASASTYVALQRFVDRARIEGVPVVFVAFPSRSKVWGAVHYELAAEVLAAIKGAGMQHLDLRRTEGLSPGSYEDDIHLNAEGQLIFTRRLALEISRVWMDRNQASAN